MMQVFRLMGAPDKVIAFDELPEDLVKGFELIKADAFSKYWKKWLGEKEIVTKIPPILNPVTGQKQSFEPFVERDSYFYLVDWNLKPVVEKWKRIEEYVRQKVSSEFRLTDKLEDMAKPLAANKVDGITLEPDEVVVIPLPKGSNVLGGTPHKQMGGEDEKIPKESKNLSLRESLPSQRTEKLFVVSQSEYEELAKITSLASNPTLENELQVLYARLRQEGKNHQDALRELLEHSKSGPSSRLSQTIGRNMAVPSVSHADSQKQSIKCEEPGCDREFDDKRGIRSHMIHKHKKEEAEVA